MHIQLTAPKIWIANEAVDFRKGMNGLCDYLVSETNKKMGDHLFVFYNRNKDKLKCLAYHRHGFILIYKRLDKKRFTLKQNESGLYDISNKQLSWLLAGLDWVSMSSDDTLEYDDYY